MIIITLVIGLFSALLLTELSLVFFKKLTLFQGFIIGALGPLFCSSMMVVIVVVILSMGLGHSAPPYLLMRVVVIIGLNTTLGGALGFLLTSRWRRKHLCESQSNAKK